VAVIQATYNGQTARAGVIIGPSESDNSGGLLTVRPLVDAVEVDLPAPGTGTPYAVTAQADDPSIPNPDEVVYPPASADHAYVPGLIAGVSYTITVYAIGPGGGLQGSQSGVIPLDPLPGILAGQGILGDIAVNKTTRKPDDTGVAGQGGAGLSGNGRYAFFFVQADSNLAPASIANPGSTLTYLVRRDLLTGEIDVASIGRDGHTPVEAAQAAGIGGELPGNVSVNADGSAVAFTDRAEIPQITLVHNFTTGESWQVGTPSIMPDDVDGLSQDGSVVIYSVTDQSTDDYHIMRQVADGAPRQIDHCPTLETQTCNYPIGQASMSEDGNLIVYQGSNPDYAAGLYNMVYLYNAATGQDSAVYRTRTCATPISFTPYPCKQYSDPVISGDGSTIASIVDDDSGGSHDYSTVITRNGQPVSTVAEGTIPYPSSAFPSSASGPLALNNDGSALIYWTTPDDNVYQLNYYRNGNSQAAPGLSNTELTSSSISLDGSLVLYTLDIGDPLTNLGYYPGVYAWQPSN
jgi:hypothetical protein